MRKNISVAAVATATAIAVLAPVAAASAVAFTPSASVAPFELNRTLTDPRIVESSGLARSTYDRGVLWTHNDSGAGTNVYAVGGSGVTKATVTLAGASARDWEDITSGPNHTLWVGDVGNNSKTRAVINVYRFTEPQTLADTTVRAQRFDFAYADGRHNSEGIMVHPVTGRLYVVTKSESGGAIYAAPEKLSTTSVNQLTKVASAPIKITAASFSRDGSRFVIGNYTTAWLYRSFGGQAVEIDKPPLKQGESLEVNRRGSGIFMGTEGANSPVYKIPMPAS